MTKTQITVRVSPDTLAAIDAAAQRQGVSRGHIIDRWLAAQAAVVPQSQTDTWRDVHELLESANFIAVRVGNRDEDPAQLHAALRLLIRAVSALNDAGTAPE